MIALKCQNWRAGKSEPTARDYVQDGLLFNWDAIENAGYGIHEEKPAKWIDLAGSGLDIPLSIRTSEWYFSDDELYTEKNESSLFKAHPQTEVLDGTVSTTVEWVERIEPGYEGSNMSGPLSINSGGAGRFVYAGGFSNWVAGGAKYKWRVGLGSAWNSNNYTFVELGDNWNGGAKFHYSISIDIGEDGETCLATQYLNGVMVKQGTAKNISIKTPNDWYVFLGNVYARLSSVRYYTRVLTAEEVLANYKVDKARFGLI